VLAAIDVAYKSWHAPGIFASWAPLVNEPLGSVIVETLTDTDVATVQDAVGRGRSALHEAWRSQVEPSHISWFDGQGYVDALQHQRVAPHTRFGCLVGGSEDECESMLVAVTTAAPTDSASRLPPFPEAFNVFNWLYDLGDAGAIPPWLDSQPFRYVTTEGSALAWFERTYAEAWATSPLNFGHFIGFGAHRLILRPPIPRAPAPREFVPTKNIGTADESGHWVVSELEGWSLELGAEWPTEWRPTVYRSLNGVDASNLLQIDHDVRPITTRDLTAVVFHTQCVRGIRSVNRHAQLYRGQVLIWRAVTGILDGGLGTIV
jgi:hypothetical protein